MTKIAKNRDDDAPLTARELKTARSARLAVPSIVAAYKAGTLRVRGRPKSAQKTPVSLRLDADILAHFRATGAGWQTRINAALRATMKRETRGSRD